jgi:predicted dehydrogenase
VVNRIGIVGGGAIAARHLANVRTLLPSAELAVSITPNGGPAEVAAKDTLATVVYGVDHLLSWGPEAVVVATPTVMHVDHALPFVSRDIPVLVEKPVDLSLPKAELLAAVATTRDVVVGVNYNMRLHRPLELLRSALKAGDVGRPLVARIEVGQHLANWRPHRPFQQSTSAQRALGGGVILELSHEIDYARWLLGEPESLFAYTRTSGELDVDVEDIAELTWETRETIVSIHLDMVQRPPVRMCKVIGADGCLIWSRAETESVMRLTPDGSIHQLYFGAANSVTWNGMYLNSMSAFLLAAGTGTAPAVGLAEGIATLRACDAAHRSASNGIRVTP